MRSLPRKVQLVLSFLFAGMYFAFPLQAGELGLWDCVRLAVTRHAVAKAGNWRVVQAQASVDEDRTAFKPELSFGAHYVARSYVPEIPIPTGPIPLGDHHDAGFTVEAGHLLYDWDRRKNRLEADLKLKKANLQSLRALRETLALEAGTGYLRLLAARREQKIAERSVEIARTHHEHLLAFHRSGLTTWDEVLKAQVHLEQSRVMLSRSSNQVRLARADLLQRISMSLDSKASFSDRVEGLPLEGSGEQGLDSVLARRPDLRAYNARLASLESLAETFATDDKPAVRMFASASFARPGVDQFRNEWIGYGRIGIGLDWQFFDWGRKDYRVAKVKAQWEETLAERRVLSQQIALQLERAKLAEQEAADRLSLAGKAQEAAKEHFRIVSARFDQGQLTNTEYLDAEENVTVSDLELSHTELDLALARWRLAYTEGILVAEIDSRWPEVEMETEEIFSK